MRNAAREAELLFASFLGQQAFYWNSNGLAGSVVPPSLRYEAIGGK